MRPPEARPRRRPKKAPGASTPDSGGKARPKVSTPKVPRGDRSTIPMNGGALRALCLFWRRWAEECGMILCETWGDVRVEYSSLALLETTGREFRMRVSWTKCLLGLLTLPPPTPTRDPGLYICWVTVGNGGPRCPWEMIRVPFLTFHNLGRIMKSIRGCYSKKKFRGKSEQGRRKGMPSTGGCTSDSTAHSIPDRSWLPRGSIHLFSKTPCFSPGFSGIPSCFYGVLE